jgi:hypothetical protein
MSLPLSDIARDLVAVMVGGVIGLAFGTLQQTALRRNEERARSGKLNSGWSLMPGAGARVAYLLIALALVQFICPLLFVEGTQWWVSGGLVLGYGWMLYQQLRHRLTAARRH